MNKDYQWCRYQSHIYQCWQRTNEQALLTYPGHSAPGWVNVSPALGEPLLLPAMAWVPVQLVQFFPSESIPALPSIPITPGIQIGSRVSWGTSLAEWAVIALNGSEAKIRQVSGWAAAIVFDAPVAELRSLSEVVPLEARKTAA